MEKKKFLEELMNTKFKTLVIDREVTGRSDVPVVFTARFNRTSDETVHVF